MRFGCVWRRWLDEGWGGGGGRRGLDEGWGGCGGRRGLDEDQAGGCERTWLASVCFCPSAAEEAQWAA